MPHWTKKFFIDEGDHWLYLMDRHWQFALRQARQIDKIIKGFSIKKGKILELACGNGRICTNLAKKGYQVTGVDISPAYIKDAIRKAQKKSIKVNYICGDIRHIDRHVRGKFDVIISIFTAIGYYKKSTDETIFRKAAKLLRKKGLFMVLNTMSREWLLNHFCPSIYDDIGAYLVVHQPQFDQFHSVNKEKWIFYKKIGKDLKYETKLDLNLRIYGTSELVEMAEKAGLKFAQAYDLLGTLAPARSDSRINMVFKKP
jgi:SAM-dependent methyltransferase